MAPCVAEQRLRRTWRMTSLTHLPRTTAAMVCWQRSLGQGQDHSHQTLLWTTLPPANTTMLYVGLCWPCPMLYVDLCWPRLVAMVVAYTNPLIRFCDPVADWSVLATIWQCVWFLQLLDLSTHKAVLHPCFSKECNITCGMKLRLSTSVNRIMTQAAA